MDKIFPGKVDAPFSHAQWMLVLLSLFPDDLVALGVPPSVMTRDHGAAIYIELVLHKKKWAPQASSTRYLL